MRICSKCSRLLPPSEFYVCSGRRRADCKSCHVTSAAARAAKRRWKGRHKKQLNASRRRRSQERHEEARQQAVEPCPWCGDPKRVVEACASCAHLRQRATLIGMNPDLAWAVGLFEGEGCISILDMPRRRHVKLVLGSTDEDVVRRFAAVVECGCVNGPYSPKKGRPLWRWEAAAQLDVAAVLSAMLPLLGERRRSVAAEAISCIEIASENGVRFKTRTNTSRKYGRQF